MRFDYDLFLKWALIVVTLVVLMAVFSLAHAECTMTTVIDPNTGAIKMCTQCCEAGMCTVVCN